MGDRADLKGSHMAVVDAPRTSVPMAAFLAVVAAPYEGITLRDDAEDLLEFMREVLRELGVVDLDDLQGSEDMHRFVSEFIGQGIRKGFLVIAQAEPMRALLWD